MTTDKFGVPIVRCDDATFQKLLIKLGGKGN